MRPFKKINTYLLENHSLLWHSKFIQLTFAGLLFWLVSYICGYVMVDLETISESYLGNFYTRSNFVSFHVVYCLIVICIWAIFFFKNNAIKSFYPLQRFYLIKLFLQLFVAFTILVSANYPFTAGTYAKVRSVLNGESFEKEIDKLNIGSAFLVSNNSQYYFEYRDDIEALNLSSVYYDEDGKEWTNKSGYLYYPELLDEKYTGSKLYFRDFTENNDSNITIIDGEKYLFFETVEKYTSPEECESRIFIKDFHKLDGIKDLHQYAMINYEGTKFDYPHSENEELFQKQQLPKIHDWARNNQKDSIEKAIQDFMDVCTRLKVDFTLNAGLISKYLEAKEYIHLVTIANSNQYSSAGEFNFNQREDAEMIEKYSGEKQLEEKDKIAFIQAMEKQNYLFYDSETIHKILSNYGRSLNPKFSNDYFGYLFLGFFIAWLFLLFEFTKNVSLLISIPVGGVITILTAIVIIYLDVYDRHDGSRWGAKVSTIIVLFVCLSVFLITIYGIFSKKFNKKILDILINLSYVLAPGLITLTVLTLNVLSGHQVVRRCGGYDYVYDYFHLLKPAWILLYALIGVCCYFPLITKWRAREE